MVNRGTCTTGLIALAMLAAGLLAVAAPAGAAVIQFMQFQQLTFMPADPEVPPEPLSDVGMVTVFFTKDPDTGYLNIAAMLPGISTDPVWLIQNFVMPDFTMGPPAEEVGMRFPLSELGLEAGTVCPPLEYAVSVSTTPFTTVDGEAWALTALRDQVAPVDEVLIAEAQGAASEVDTTSLTSLPADPHQWRQDFLLGGLIETETMIGCEMHNIPLDTLTRKGDWNGCVPASAANSLHWLKDKHGDCYFPGDERQTFDGLSALMNRMYQKGATAKEMARAKLDFIEAHGLPIHVKVQNYFSDGNISSSSGESTAEDTDGVGEGSLPKKDWLFSEAKKGEDVEVIYGFWYIKDGQWHRDGGHAVAVSGTGTVLGIPTLWFKHDSKQSDGTGTVQDYAPIRVTSSGGMELVGRGGKWKHQGDPVEYEHRAFVDGVVSESRDEKVPPPPAEETMGGYCQEFTRTIPPGKSLYIHFPDVYFRCLNMTVYRWDRSTNPPTQVKEGEWNNNDNSVREMHNASDVPVTYTFHNDDYVPGWIQYTPWTVGLSMGSPSLIKTTTPYNTGTWGGFSVGWSDGSGAEFGPVGGTLVTIDAGPGCDLSTIPQRLAQLPGNGAQRLELFEVVPGWNPNWERLAFVIDVLEVTSPGDLLVEMNGTMEQIVLAIAGPGRYEFIWAIPLPAAPEVRVALQPLAGLDILVDCIGLPSVGGLSAVGEGGDTPVRPVLTSITPNPFNPSAVIRFGVPVDGPAVLDVYDIKGRRVATVFEGDLTAGYHEETWGGVDDRGNPVAAGTYLARLKVRDHVVTRKMSLVR